MDKSKTDPKSPCETVLRGFYVGLHLFLSLFQGCLLDKLQMWKSDRSKDSLSFRFYYSTTVLVPFQVLNMIILIKYLPGSGSRHFRKFVPLIFANWMSMSHCSKHLGGYTYLANQHMESLPLSGTNWNIETWQKLVVFNFNSNSFFIKQACHTPELKHVEKSIHRPRINTPILHQDWKNKWVIYSS